MPLSLHRINISHFRCYEAARLDLTDGDSQAARMVVLTGPNGAGKTNILEAVSLLVPGKGLRSADILDMKSRSAAAEDIWAVSAELETAPRRSGADINSGAGTAPGLPLRIGTGLDPEKKRRLIRINGKDAKTQNELSSFISAVWLTPQMDRLFLEGPSARRKFLDRLVYAYEPDHVTRLNRYDKTLRERIKLLQMERSADPQWLSSLEAQLAADAVAIAASRLALLQHLQQHVDMQGPLFPRAGLALEGWTEQQIGFRPALDIEDELKNKFAAGRSADRDAGRTHDGVHRSDFLVTYTEKNMPAAQCSTGEQKALLVSIVLAHALMMQAEKGFVPIILLDEVAAHLDEARRLQLFAQLQLLQGQVWLTGTDAQIFASLRDTAKFFKVEQGRVSAENVLRVVSK